MQQITIKDDADLYIHGHATDHIWLMEDGPKSHPIGIRVDSGDSGTLYVSRSQAKDLAEQLLDFAGENPTWEAPAPKCPKCGKCSVGKRLIVHVTEDVPLCPFCGNVLVERRHHERRQGERRTSSPVHTCALDRGDDWSHMPDDNCVELRTGRDRRTEDRRKA